MTFYYDSVTELLICVWRTWPAPALALLIVGGGLLTLFVAYGCWSNWQTWKKETRGLAEANEWQRRTRL